MRASRVTVRNYRTFDSDGSTVEFGDLTALVGANNSGKSNFIYALDFFFNFSKSKITPESFFHRDTGQAIEILGEFQDLTAEEKDYFQGYPIGDTLKVLRRFSLGQDEEGEPSPEIEHSGLFLVPKQRWLRQDLVTREAITEWLTKAEELVVRGASFLEFLPDQKRPTVVAWKTAIPTYLEALGERAEWIEEEKPRLKGWANVLKGGLPHFILLPAVRAVGEETKLQKTNPYGRVVSSILTDIPEEATSQLEASLDGIRHLLNRSGQKNRLQRAADLEARLGRILNEHMDADLEIRVTPPTLEELLARGLEIWMDDGFRSAISDKGHGLQRATILALFRAHFELENELRTAQDKFTRSTIYAIEEPELYLHPQTQRATMKLLRRIAADADQVVYSTHSPYFVDVGYFDEVRMLRIGDENGKRHSRVVSLSAEDLVADLKARWPKSSPTRDSIRQRYLNVYDEAKNEGFFASKVIIAEGDTEKHCLPIYAQALGVDFDRMNISVVNAGGKGNIDRLFRVFNEFEIPCYLVFDYDQDRHHKEPELKRQAVEILSLLGISEQVALDHVVHERFAMAPSDIEDIIRGEIDDYDELVVAVRGELGLKPQRAKGLVARGMALRLTERGRQEGDPAKYVPPTFREIIGKVRLLEWQGSILAARAET